MPQRNRVLGALLSEAAWTQEELARQVNALADEVGLSVRLDRRSVAHWLAGRRPRPPVPGLVAEAFTRVLGRPVTPAMIGMHPTGCQGKVPEPELARDSWSGNPVQTLQQLGPVGRQGWVMARPYSVAALAVPAWTDTVSAPRLEPPGKGQLDPDGVATAELMTRVFSDADLAFGGGHSRTALMSYLSSDVAAQLRADGPGRLRSRIRSAACQLTYLAGFMCFDDEQHAHAQTYYRIALELAADNGDAGAYAVTLRAMSIQARLLGHTREAVHLAETAAAAGRNTPPIRQAFLLGQLAVAAAADGDRSAGLATFSAAERHFERATSRTAQIADDPMGGFHLAALAHQQAVVQELLGDRHGAIKALTGSMRHRPPGERRSQAITVARVAELHLALGHLDQAVTVWEAFLADYPHLRSGRAARALASMRGRLRPYAAQPAVRRLLTRAATL